MRHGRLLDSLDKAVPVYVHGLKIFYNSDEDAALLNLTEINCIMDIRFFCSMFPKSTHETFAQKLYQTFKNNKRFTKPKLSRTSFAISHYAGEVKHLSHAYDKFIYFSC